MTTLAAGSPTCATITLLDGLVYARSAFESSMHYRSATILGSATKVPADEVLDAVRVLTEHLMPGRWQELRAPTRKELAATLVVALPLQEWSVKVSDGPPSDPEADLTAPVWAGVLPLRLAAGTPVDAPDLGPDRPVPAYAGGSFPTLAGT
jgi:nitroimidazol reductase NimA-like FMN-containing flavoprotein (pyridoxamine 5'-phosphate oxidase superfamily)